MKKKPELLAPAGDLERLKIAVIYGADAVYIGGPILGLRANAINFTFDEIKEGVEFAHKHHAKVYVTVNIILHNKELKSVKSYLKQIEECGVDAIIVSDPTVMEIAHSCTNLEVHISTQKSTFNIEACKFFKNEGATRIVLGREVNREDIKKIRENVNIELECFIHGAMCSGISGRCVLSNIFTGRDANRGGCAQICRWDFDLYDESNNKIEGEKPFTFCAKDLSMLKYIPEMMDLGITSFKIEGRMRSIYYIATVVGVYRKVIDEYYRHPDTYKYNKEYERILRNVANRDAVPQFFNGVKDVRCNYYNGREEVSNQDFLGIVLDYNDDLKLAIIEQRNYFKVGDEVEVFGPNIDTTKFKISSILDENNNIIDIVRHPRQIVKIRVPIKLHPYDMIRLDKTGKV